MFTPNIVSRDDDAVRERRLARGGKKAVDALLLEAIRLGVQLALYSMVLAGSQGARRQTDASAVIVELLRPIGIPPHFVIQVAVGAIILQVGLVQLLKVGTFFAFGTCAGAVRVEQNGQGGG